MSNWTHVGGIVRVNGFSFDPKKEFEKIFGRECLYDSPDEVWDDYKKHPDNYLPMGSEGSLRMTIWTNPDKEHLDRYTISIFGDLRDHHDPQKIVDWFKEKLKDVWVRQAVITVWNECNGSITYTHEKG